MRATWKGLGIVFLGALAGSACEGALSIGGGDAAIARTDAGALDRDASPALDAGPGTDAGPPIDSGPLPDGALPPDAGPADAGPLAPCATVTCGANARCEPSSGACVCSPGFTMSGSGCVAIAPGDPAGRTATEVCAQWRDGHVENERDPWNEVAGDTCAPGTLTAAAIADTVRRVNMFRWMVGLEPVTDDPAQHPNDQACALMMTRNGALDHSPDTDWTCYSAGGAAGAGSSNLALGIGSPAAAIDLYVDDSGVPSLGHRRWIFNGPLGSVGIGFAGNAQCLGVFDRSGSSDRMWTAWPNPGPVPLDAIRGLWSFSSNRLATSGATPRVVRVGDGMTLPVTVSHPADGYGPSTVAWAPSGWSAAAGQRYRVTVDGVTGGPIVYEVEPVPCP